MGVLSVLYESVTPRTRQLDAGGYYLVGEAV